VTELTLIVRALSVLLIALTLLPLIRSARWWIRVWDYPRLQLAIALLLLLAAQTGLALLDGDRTHTAGIVFLVATACACAGQLFSIWPYTRAHRLQSLPARAAHDPDRRISLLVANVLQSNHNARGFLDIVREMNPDIIIAVETNGWWDAQLSELSDRYPFIVRVPLENTYGMHVFSSLELRDVQKRALVSEDIPSVRATVRLRSGDEFDLYAVHPEPPLPAQDADERDAELLLVAREAKERRRPAIVAGDLNDVAWSHTTRLFQRVSELLDPRVGRGIYPTFHTGYRLLRWPLDHLFHDPSFRVADLRVLRAYGSDHFPIFASLEFDPQAARQAETPRSDRSDEQEASEKIAEAGSA
jgi:endonuclease/exonuclease/phosphatase (EEP) superfamily protein YafD